MKLGANDVSAVKIGATDVNKVYLGSNLVWEKVSPLLLDLYPNAAAAYSLRKLRTDYSGASIKVRRSSDNTEQDIGFVNNELDTTSLLAFVGAGDGFVTTWYDQSGGSNATQGSASKQPKIVNSGAVITENGEPSVEFNGTTDYIQNQLSVGPTVTSFAVSKIADEFDNYFIYDSFGTNGRIRLGLVANQGYFADNGDGSYVYATTASNGSQNLFFTKHTNSEVSISVDQDTLQTVSNTNFSQSTEYWNIGARNNGSDHFLYGTIQELIIYPSDQSANRAGIETNINSNYNIYWDGSQTGLLDDYPNASAAYSLRALNSAYTGAAIRVRRSSDNEEQDINLLYDGSLNTDSLLAFVGAGDGFVTTWYDQSGGGNDATQTTASNQPKIVSSGSVILDNGKPAVQFDGSNDNLPNGAGTTLPSDVSAFAVRSLSSYPTTYRSMFNYKTYGLTHNSNGGASYGLAHIFSNETAVKSIDYPTTTGQALDFLYNKSNLERNNFISTLSSGGVYGTGVSGIGSWSGTSQCFLGNIQELVIYEINQNTNKSGIKSNINSHYNIY